MTTDTTAPITSIVIAGGGTAGWMAAVALQHYLQNTDCKIVLVESSEISTVGVGEATLPNLRSFHHRVAIDEKQFMRATGATFKLGIRFDGWAGAETSFFHPFCPYGERIGSAPFFNYWVSARREGRCGPIGDFSYGTQLALAGRFAQPADHPPAQFADFTYAYHFDATRYAAFLRSVAEARGVQRIDGRIEKAIVRYGSSMIDALVLSDGRQVEGQLFIDCTGFRALLIAGALQVEYEDWSGWLPVDRAITIPTTADLAPQPYTHSLAMTAGWRWRIPLQHRTGNGYVFCSRYISDDAALDELRSQLTNQELAEPHLIKFATGRRRVFWEGNCVAIGLSSGFLEPLESTSIALIQSAISKLLTFFPDTAMSAVLRREANSAMAEEVERIRDFVILHYHLNGRRSEQFWCDARASTLPEPLVRKIDLFRENGQILRFAHESFEEPSWYSMYAGFEVYPRHSCRPRDMDASCAAMADIASIIARGIATAPAHIEFLRYHQILKSDNC